MALFVFLFFLSMCTSPQSASLNPSLLKKIPLPEVRIKDFDIKSISLRDIDFLFDIEITNPYPVGIRLEKVDFKVDVDKNELFRTTTPSGFKIKAQGSAITPLVLNLEYAKIINIVKDYNNKEYLLCEISGNLLIPLPDIPGLPKTFSFPFNVSKKIPAIRPSVSIHNFKVSAPSRTEIQEAIRKAGQNLNVDKVINFFGDLIGGKKVNIKEIGLADLDLKLKVNFDLSLKNEAKAKLLFDKLNYDFFINDEKVFRGDTSKTQLESATLVVSIANELSSKSLGKSVLKIFEERKGIFKIKGETFINLPPEIKKAPLRLTFDEGGNFDL